MCIIRVVATAVPFSKTGVMPTEDSSSSNQDSTMVKPL